MRICLKSHATYLNKKIAPRIYFLNRLKRFVPKDKLPQLFRAIVFSLAESAVQI